MSSSLAISAVTAVLRRLIESSLVRHDFASVLDLGAQPVVSTLPPDRLAPGAAAGSRINLFLFQATENAALRNADMPARNARGDRLGNPRLALDLHYLITAYGADDLHAEALLGHAMFVMHETPVLPREAIREGLAGLVADSPGPLATALAASRLAEQMEQIRIVPRVLNIEEVSKVWTALQAQYRPTAAYHISVVLIEATQPARAPLPVLTRGGWDAALQRDLGVAAQAGLGSPVPALEEIVYPSGNVAARTGDVITLCGRRLAGAAVVARFRELRGDAVLELPAQAGGSATAFSVQLPFDPPPAGTPAGSPAHPANWRSGLYEVSGIVTEGGRTFETGRLPVALAPRIDALTSAMAGGALASITVACSPPVRPTQDAVLVVGDRELRPDAFAAPTGALVFPVEAGAYPAGSYPVRLRVDGIESLLVDRVATPPRFHPSQVLVVP